MIQASIKVVEKDAVFHWVKHLLEIIETWVDRATLLDIISHNFLDDFSGVST